MQKRNLSFVIIFFVCLVSTSCKEKDETGQPPLVSRLLGKWQVISKTDTDSIGNQETKREQDLYTKGEKTYEFTNSNKLLVVERYRTAPGNTARVDESRKALHRPEPPE